MPLAIFMRQLAADILAATLFLTRLPLANASAISGTDLARATWAFPVAGAIVGVLAAIAYWLARTLGLPPFPAAVLTVAATIAITGCLHEDGLADVADSFGGSTRERRLEIMRDSAIGAYGTCAIALSVLLRASALASIPEPMAATAALIAAHVSARAILPPLMRLVPCARADGLAAGAGRPPRDAAIVAGVLGVIVLAIGLGPATGGCALLLLVLAALCFTLVILRAIGGQTGDTLGAIEQIAEIVILLVAARSNL